MESIKESIFSTKEGMKNNIDGHWSMEIQNSRNHFFEGKKQHSGKWFKSMNIQRNYSIFVVKFPGFLAVKIIIFGDFFQVIFGLILAFL